MNNNYGNRFRPTIICVGVGKWPRLLVFMRVEQHDGSTNNLIFKLRHACIHEWWRIVIICFLWTLTFPWTLWSTINAWKNISKWVRAHRIFILLPHRRDRFLAVESNEPTADQSGVCSLCMAKFSPIEGWCNFMWTTGAVSEDWKKVPPSVCVPAHTILEIDDWHSYGGWSVGRETYVNTWAISKTMKYVYVSFTGLSTVSSPFCTS